MPFCCMSPIPKMAFRVRFREVAMNPRIALNFEDGITHFIDATPNETVAHAT
ncbi:hypothetical protein HK44_010230 [Pseudomonas fluorescens HK44]|uniref:Uncharacterized protein n=1 Tax=Pseudomonas fluorescens HK44 TaxID=1042209 RepID=A0A010TA15_PSEFL|nr:hypothetical protein HK44_010230 [Pseudomonas fluorescens HK44]